MRPIIAVLFTTVVPTLVGRRLVRGPAPVRWGLGSVFGIALLAWGTMVGALLGSAETGAVAVMVVATFAGRFVTQRPAAVPHQTPVIPMVAVGLIGALLLGLALIRPVARFDGWAFWSLKAKAIASTGDFRSPVFNDPLYEYTHRDYPPLIPAWQALAYRISGDQTRGYPTQFQLAWLWTSAGIALVALAGRRRSAAGVVLIAWLIAPQVVDEAISGYADVPMALFLVLGGTALLRSGEVGLLPGASLIGAAAVTKTEGVLFAAAAVAPILIARPYRRRALVAGAAIVAALGPWTVWTTSHGLAGDLTRPPSDVEQVATDRDPIERLPTVLEGLGEEATKPGNWGILLPAALLVLGSARFRPVPLAMGFVFACAAAILVYLFSPYEVVWHLSRSAERLTIAPLGLLALAVEGRNLTSPRDPVAAEGG